MNYLAVHARGSAHQVLARSDNDRRGAHKFNPPNRIRTPQPVVRRKASGDGPSLAPRLRDVSERPSHVPSAVFYDQRTQGHDAPPPVHVRALIEDGRVFSEIFPVRFDEVGPDKACTMRTVASMMQECACNHIQAMWGKGQSSPAEMRSNNQAFVCTQMHIEVHEYPRWGDEVEVKTWVEVERSVSARRDFELVLCDGPEGTCRAVGAATSRWVAFDVAKRRMVRIPKKTTEDVTNYHALLNNYIMGEDYVMPKLPDVRNTNLPLSQPKAFTGDRLDLDMNGHVNNVVYTKWILESVPVDMWIDYQLYELDIEFKSECGYGDVIAAVTAREGSAEGVVIEEDNARVLHQLVKLGDDGKETEVIRARTSWRRKGAMTAEEKEMAAVIAAAWGPKKKGPGGKAKGRLGGIGPGSVDAALLAR